VVLAGHPRLKHELRRPAREEIGARTTVLELERVFPARFGERQAISEGYLNSCSAM